MTPQPMPPTATPVQQMAGDYRIYLAQERGLAAGTIRRYVRDAGLFLTEYLARDDSDLGALTPGEVTDFVLRECRRRGPGSARNLVASLRSLLRFCYLQGDRGGSRRRCQPRAGAGVPCRARWRPGRCRRLLRAATGTPCRAAAITRSLTCWPAWGCGRGGRGPGTR